jgi:uncharacterized membrane protein YkoI
MRVQFVLVAALGSALSVGCANMCPKKDKAETGGAEAKTVQIEQSQVPAKVMTAFQEDHPNVKLEKAKKETYADGTVHYEFEWKDTAGKEHEVEYSADGEQLDKH